MSCQTSTWLSGAAVATPERRSPSTIKIAIDLFLLTHPSGGLSLKFLDKHRATMAEWQSEVSARIDAEAASTDSGCPLTKRIKEVFGEREFVHSKFDAVLPDEALRECSFLALSVFELDRVSCVDPCGPENGRSVDRIYLEFPKRRLPLDKEGQSGLFFLVTPRQARSRMEQIIAKYRLEKRRDDATAEALARLTFDLYSGIDSPLLTDDLEND